MTTNNDLLDEKIIDADEVQSAGINVVIKKIKDILGPNKTYVTFDIDCLDPAFAPGTGTSVWGGLSLPRWQPFYEGWQV